MSYITWPEIQTVSQLFTFIVKSSHLRFRLFKGFKDNFHSKQGVKKKLLKATYSFERYAHLLDLESKGLNLLSDMHQFFYHNL